MTNATLILAAAAAAIALPASAAATLQAEAPPGATAPAARAAEAAPHAAAGFLHGTVKTTSGATYRGLLRWGSEEAFWGDHFNSSKAENAFPDEVPRRERRRKTISIFGVRMRVRDDGDADRQLVVRFGDLAAIDVEGRGDAVLRLKNGTRVPVSGGANDVEADVVVWDDALGKVEVPWRKIETVEFSPAPAGVRPYATRLYGTVETDAGRFEGFIQWDSQECVSTDELDGDSDDGKVSIEMGRIRTIARRGRSSARVTLADGRELVLSGTNDVDDSIRGIFVDDRRYGRVKVSWDAFDRLDLRPPPDSGPGYDQFAPASPLRGTVTAEDGRTLSGRIVFDLDESEGWEILQGSARDVEYLIPFAEIASIAPRGSRGSLVALRNGEELRLEDGNDVDEDNAGVLVYRGDASRPDYLPWDEVRRIDFDR